MSAAEGAKSYEARLRRARTHWFDDYPEARGALEGLYGDALGLARDADAELGRARGALVLAGRELDRLRGAAPPRCGDREGVRDLVRLIESGVSVLIMTQRLQDLDPAVRVALRRRNYRAFVEGVGEVGL